MIDFNYRRQINVKLKGKPKEGIKGIAFEIPEDHDPTSVEDANDLLSRPGVPLGVIFKKEGKSLEDRYQDMAARAPKRTNDELLDSYLLQ